MKKNFSIESRKKRKGEMKADISAVIHLTILPESSINHSDIEQNSGKKGKSVLTCSYLFLPETIPKPSYLNNILLT